MEDDFTLLATSFLTPYAEDKDQEELVQKQKCYALSSEICHTLETDQTFAHPDRLTSLLTEVLLHLKREKRNKKNRLLLDRKTLLRIMYQGFSILTSEELAFFLQDSEKRKKDKDK
jgi:hypothetical protein